ncbi:MAG: YdcF family protein [Oscillospiraceae bacterium]|nr:YdcF family protein [Oscillospiraceae bacterium]
MKLRHMTPERGKVALIRLGYSTLLATVLFCIAILSAALIHRGTLTVRLPENVSAASFAADTRTLEITERSDHTLTIRGKAPGIAELVSTDGTVYMIHILPGGILYNEFDGDFSGSHAVVLIVQIYTFIMTILLGASYLIRQKIELFSYTTLYFGGASLFLCSVSINLLIAVIFIYKQPENLSMLHIYTLLCESGSAFMLLSFPLMTSFSVGLAVSNIDLIRHEGISFPKVLGLLTSVLILGGYVLGFWLSAVYSVEGSKLPFRTAFSVYTTSFVYCEAMLMSAILCGIRAAMHRPDYDKTHVIILGCSIAADGTPLPLLRGRIDAALEFAREQKAQTGRDIIFVPSGGKGADECIAEAESMHNYLIGQGIPESRILVEDKSATTRENMRFSYAKIKAQEQNPRILFSTTNYHVLRSGILSRSEGLEADGIGSRTKWYFWPNAFIREFIGLLAGKKRQHLFWLASFILGFALLNSLLD